MRLESKPVSKTFSIKADPDGLMQITIRQAAFGESKALAELTKKQRRVIDPSAQLVYEQDFNFLSEYAEKIYLTTENIEGCTDEHGEELFKFIQTGNRRHPANRVAFFNALERLPQRIVFEMHDYVLEMNPQWAGADGEGE